MPVTVDITIAPNEKYREVIHGDLPEDDGVPETEDEYREQANHPEATEAYLETIENTPDPEEHGVDPDDLDVLTWKDISPASDPDLLSKIATYFDGMHADEPTERIRAKCRLLDVDIYTDAQIAARAELRRE